MLALVVAFAAVWFIALRPGGGGEEPPPPQTAPGESAIPGAPGNAVDRAREGGAQADADNAARPGQVETAAGGGSGGSAAAPAPGANPGTPGAPALGGEIQVTGAGGVPRGASPVAVRAALRRGRVVVVLFYGRGADDSGVAGQLSQVNRRRGRVAVFRASITQVSRFTPVTTGVRVLESPTVVVAGPGRRGRALAGYVEASEIDQAVSSLLHRR